MNTYYRIYWVTAGGLYKAGSRSPIRNKRGLSENHKLYCDQQEAVDIFKEYVSTHHKTGQYVLQNVGGNDPISIVAISDSSGNIIEIT